MRGRSVATQEGRPDQEVEAADDNVLGGAGVENGSHPSIDDERVLRLLNDAAGHAEQAQLAHVFAADNIDRLIHVFGLGWFAWDGQRWREDTGEAQNAALGTIRRLWRESMENKALQAMLLRNQRASGIAGVLTLASRLPGIAAHVDDLDSEPYRLNCANGVLDLQTLVLHDHDPRGRHTKITRAAYDTTARSEVWESFLERVLPDPEVRGYFQRLAGLALLGEVREHIFPIATGTGRNGKGVAYGAMMHAFGDYAGVAAPGLFEQVKSNPNAASPATAALRGIRLLVASESEEGARLAPALVKRLIGGDRLIGRELHKGLIEFDPSHLILYITNHLPLLPAGDPSVWLKIRVILFEVVIPAAEQDPDLGSKLRGEADAILAWMVEGLREYWGRGLDEPRAVLVATNTYADSQDDVLRFISDQCVEGGDDTTSTLHDAFREWALADGIHLNQVLGRTKFGEQLDRLGFGAKKTSKGMVRVGLALDRSSEQAALAETSARLANAGVVYVPDSTVGDCSVEPVHSSDAVVDSLKTERLRARVERASATIDTATENLRQAREECERDDARWIQACREQGVREEHFKEHIEWARMNASGCCAAPLQVPGEWVAESQAIWDARADAERRIEHATAALDELRQVVGS